MTLYWGIGIGLLLLGLIFWLCPGAFGLLRRLWFSKGAPSKQEMYGCLYPREQPEEALWREKKQQLTKAYFVILAAAVVALCSGYVKTQSAIDTENTIVRDVFRSPEQSVYVEILAQKGEETHREEITLRVSGKAPTPEQLTALFLEAEETLAREVFSERSPEAHYVVSENLSLPQEVLGDITLSWRSSHPEVLSSMGRIGEDISSEGTLVTLSAQGSYSLPAAATGQAGEEALTEEVQQTFTFSCIVYPQKDTRSFGERLEEYLVSQELLTREGDFVLPESFEGYTLSFADTEAKQIPPGVFLGLGCLISIMLYFAAEQRVDEAYKKRMEQLNLDYPEIVSQLTVLIGAGLTVRKAWERMVLDYEKREGEPRYGYEEMRRTHLGLQSGVYEAGAYGAFGRRCGTYPYMKLGTLLETGVQKGVSDLVGQLQEETLHAFERRKLEARQAGEKAKTKLLFPTMLLLVLLIVILVVPAWLSTGVA